MRYHGDEVIYPLWHFLKNASTISVVGRLSEEKERHLLNVARELILAQGLSAVTVDKIAKAGA